MKLKVLVRPGRQRDGYVASSPVLPSFRSPGETPEEAVATLQTTLEEAFAELNAKVRAERTGHELVEIEV